MHGEIVLMTMLACSNILDLKKMSEIYYQNMAQNVEHVEYMMQKRFPDHTCRRIYTANVDGMSVHDNGHFTGPGKVILVIKGFRLKGSNIIYYMENRATEIPGEFKQ